MSPGSITLTAHVPKLRPGSWQSWLLSIPDICGSAQLMACATYGDLDLKSFLWERLFRATQTHRHRSHGYMHLKFCASAQSHVLLLLTSHGYSLSTAIQGQQLPDLLHACGAKWLQGREQSSPRKRNECRALR